MTEDKVISISTRLATPADAHLDTYDNTKMVAVNTCPTWGVLRYQMHKTFQHNSRAMALEAGSAMHEVFAAVRLYQLWKYDAIPEIADAFLEFHGNRLFGQPFDDTFGVVTTRFDIMIKHLQTEEDERTQLLNFCLEALYTSGFYDDPNDRRRTVSNLEEAAILYIDRWDFRRLPLWIRDISNPQSDVGIEIAFDLVITYTYQSGTERSFRFTGKLDGLHIKNERLVAGENKTASRLNDAWRMAFVTSSQVTGYNLAASVFTGLPCTDGFIWGLAIPLPKSYDNGGLIYETTTRETYHFARWFDWFLHSVDMYERFRNNPTDAPRYTHSCNRYFRPCSLIPFCDSSDEDQLQMIEEMITEEWSPLDEVIGED